VVKTETVLLEELEVRILMVMVGVTAALVVTAALTHGVQVAVAALEAMPVTVAQGKLELITHLLRLQVVRPVAVLLTLLLTVLVRGICPEVAVAV
jgi:hypothetical protein